MKIVTSILQHEYIKFPFLLSMRNKLIIFIPLALVTLPISIRMEPFSDDFTLRIIILSALFFILGFVGGYKSQSSDAMARQMWERTKMVSNFPLPTITSVNMVNRYYASMIPNAPPIIYLLFALSFIALFACMYAGESLGRNLFVQHYPDLAYLNEEPDN